MNGLKWQLAMVAAVMAAAGGAICLGMASGEPPRPESKAASCTSEAKTLPVLIRKAYNPLRCVKIECKEPVKATSIVVQTAGTDSLKDVKSFRVYYAGAKAPYELKEAQSDKLDGLKPFGEAAAPAAAMTFSDSLDLAAGTHYFMVSCELNDKADLFHRVCASVSEVRLGDGTALRPPQEKAADNGRLRIGVALRKAGDDGSVAYRIPGLATTKKGTLIAVYDIRYKHWGDLPARIDVGMSRSTDGGRTWEPMRAIMDMGDHNKFSGNGIGDPAVLVDRKTGTVWTAALWSHGNRSLAGSGPGLTPEESGQFMLSSSRDDGHTWSRPESITPQVKNPKWRIVFQGPGMGITTKDGVLVFAAQYWDEKKMPYSTIACSRDGGKTWKLPEGPKPNTTEAQVVELSDGTLMLNMRDNRGGSRSVYTTKDFGATWQEHPTSRKALPEPVCMASLIRFDPKGLLLFSNPDSTRGRHHMTVKVSPDDGKTWPEKWHTLVDEQGSAGYSCLTQIDAKTVGILYEGSRAALVFQVFKIDELMPSETAAKEAKP